MKQINLIDKLRSLFPGGIKHSDAVELCIAFYCSSNWFSDVREDEFSKKNIVNVFSQLAGDGYIEYNPIISHERGAFESFKLPEHWNKIINSALKLNWFYDRDAVTLLLSIDSEMQDKD